jgi:uncharacterized protein YjiS (DUF1127 family)
MMITRFFSSKKRKSVAEQARFNPTRLSAADLADMGIKRYQLETQFHG